MVRWVMTARRSEGAESTGACNVEVPFLVDGIAKRRRQDPFFFFSPSLSTLYHALLSKTVSLISSYLSKLSKKG